MFKTTECPFCTSNLVADISYLDDKHTVVHTVKEVPLSYLVLPLQKYKHSRPYATAVYCPLHRILFKIEDISE